MTKFRTNYRTVFDINTVWATDYEVSTDVETITNWHEVFQTILDPKTSFATFVATDTTTITDLEVDTATTTVTIIALSSASTATAVKARSAAKDKCHAISVGPSQMPWYASTVCVDTVQYSSACSRLNVPHLTYTAQPCVQIATVTSEIAKTISNTVYVTVTSTVTKPVTIHTRVILKSAKVDTTTVDTTISRTATSWSTLSSITNVEKTATLFSTQETDVFVTLTSRTVVPVTFDATTTVLVTATATITPVCNNEGLQWALYPNNQGNNWDSAYRVFDPTIYASQQPTQKNITSQIGSFYWSGGSETIYDSQPFEVADFTLDHRGYILAPQSGIYNFRFVNTIDDIGLIWLGPAAYSGWNRGNAAAVLAYQTTGSMAATWMANAGDYIPFRVMYANAQGVAVLNFSVNAPDGTILIDGGTRLTDNVIQFSCDQTTAPPFPAWGSE